MELGGGVGSGEGGSGCWDEFNQGVISLIRFHFIFVQIFFPSFLQSDIYYKYLTELLNSVTERPMMTSSSSREDTSTVGRLDESSRLVTSYGSDLDLTEDPDAIWHRPNAG